MPHASVKDGRRCDGWSIFRVGQSPRDARDGVGYFCDGCGAENPSKLPQLTALTQAQLLVLWMLAEGPKQTSSATQGCHVSGVSCAALERQGLVSKTASMPASYAITELGRSTLKREAPQRSP